MVAFHGSHVVVTGGTGALGTAVVAALRAAGAVCHVTNMVAAELERYPHRNDTGVHITTGVDLADEAAVRRYYAVPQKSGKIEFLHADPQQQNCVYSLFPHMGDAPCWYLLRHTEQRIDM
jgi:NAD(P)-dependent dehydrogenase (short-subunit alcohol dehydrogenase family)